MVRVSTGIINLRRIWEPIIGGDEVIDAPGGANSPVVPFRLQDALSPLGGRPFGILR
jgi:hypothetical protein